jgi:hypothetical protein
MLNITIQLQPDGKASIHIWRGQEEVAGLSIQGAELFMQTLQSQIDKAKEVSEE